MLAGKLFKIPVKGTHAHAYVTSFTGLPDLKTRTLRRCQPDKQDNQEQDDQVDKDEGHDADEADKGESDEAAEAVVEESIEPTVEESAGDDEEKEAAEEEKAEEAEEGGEEVVEEECVKVDVNETTDEEQKVLTTGIELTIANLVTAM